MTEQQAQLVIALLRRILWILAANYGLDRSIEEFDGNVT